MCSSRPRKPGPHGTREGPEVDQRLRSGGRWASQNSGEGEPVLFTPDSPSPSLRGRRAFTDRVRHSLGSTGRLPGDRGLHPRSGWSSEIPPGTSSSPQAQRCVSHRASRDLGGPTLVSIACEAGAAGTREHCPGAGLDFSREAGDPAATWGELMVREGTRVLRGPGEAPWGPEHSAGGRGTARPAFPPLVKAPVKVPIG